jgi:hypothetical protein
MALWGKADSLYSGGTVAVNYAAKTITGSGTSFTAAGISTGTVITIGVGGTYGQAVISGITSATLVSIATTQYLTGAAIAGVAYTMSQKPIYTLEDTNYNSIQTTSTGLTNFIEGVDEYEAAALRETGSNYAVAHAGWVGVHTYTDMHGTVRVKSETLVAMSGISSNTSPTYLATGDANDDATLPDRYITISSQPSNLGLTTTTSGTFSVTAAATPAAALAYQWKVSTNGGTSYSNAAGGTSATVTIANPALSANGYLYRVVITSDGGATLTSNTATLTVTA